MLQFFLRYLTTVKFRSQVVLTMYVYIFISVILLILHTPMVISLSIYRQSFGWSMVWSFCTSYGRFSRYVYVSINYSKIRAFSELGRIHLPHLQTCKYIMDDSSANFWTRLSFIFSQKFGKKMKKNLVWLAPSTHFSADYG